MSDLEGGRLGVRVATFSISASSFFEYSPEHHENWVRFSEAANSAHELTASLSPLARPLAEGSLLPNGDIRPCLADDIHP
jgi:hypothetical protein